MSDIVERLNKYKCAGDPTKYTAFATVAEVQEAAQAITALTAERDALKADNDWNYEFSPTGGPDGFVEVAFDEGLGFISVRVCQRIVTKSHSTYDTPLPVENYEYGWEDADKRMIKTDRQPYAWRNITLPKLSAYEAIINREAALKGQP